MTRRIEQVNELLRGELARLISENIDLSGGLVTVITVNTSSDLRYARVSISVLPENLTGTALRELKKHNTVFTKEMKKKFSMKFIPRLHWVVDANERYAAEIDRAIAESEQ